MKTAFKWLAGLVSILAVVLLGGYLVFVPSPQEPGYEFVASFGSQGSAPGEFHDPTGLAVADEQLFVADARNGRIQVFDFEGNLLRTFGEPGSALGELGRPMNLETAHGMLYVPEYFNDRVQIFDLEGTPVETVGEPGSGRGQFRAPGGVAVDEDGNLHVADFRNQRVQKLGPGGRFIRQWGVTDESGVAAGRFSYPTDVALGRENTLYVADGYNDRIQAFAEDGRFVRKWGGPLAMNIYGPFNGWFTTVTGIAVDARGHVFAADFYNHRIQKFSADGQFLTSFGSRGTGPGQLDYPIAVAVAEDGTVFVADYGNQRIQRWRPRER